MLNRNHVLGMSIHKNWSCIHLTRATCLHHMRIIIPFIICCISYFSFHSSFHEKFVGRFSMTLFFSIFFLALLIPIHVFQGSFYTLKQCRRTGTIFFYMFSFHALIFHPWIQVFYLRFISMFVICLYISSTRTCFCLHCTSIFAYHLPYLTLIILTFSLLSAIVDIVANLSRMKSKP